MREFVALDLTWPSAPTADQIDIASAWLDDFSPSAIEDRPQGLRVFFTSGALRDQARLALAEQLPHIAIASLVVPDEGWAERSQADLKAVTVADITVAPPWAVPHVSDARTLVVLISPSMGFGTGHHASTRLCLALLQRHVPRGSRVIDVGTGSGVLAIASWRVGAAHALGIDCDADALLAAAESVALNEAAAHVTLAVCDVTREPVPHAGEYALAFANLTGGMLIRTADRLVAALAPGGIVIASGFQLHEREDVIAAFTSAGADPIDEASEDGWIGAAFGRRAASR